MGLSITHLVIIVVILLLIFGPSRLPSLGKSVGEAIRGFKSGMDGSGDIDVTDSAKREQLSADKVAAEAAAKKEAEKNSRG